METCRPYGRTGSTTGTNAENDTNNFHGNITNNGRYQDHVGSSAAEERRPGETLQEYLDRQEAVNGNNRHSSSRSTFRSGSELTSDSDFLEERRNSNQSDTDVFFPSTEPEINEQKRILDQKRRELPPGHRSWKRVADYVNGLPIIPEPSAQGVAQNENIGQAKRQRIWSEVHDKRRMFIESGSLSFAEGMTSQKHAQSTSRFHPPLKRRLSSGKGEKRSNLSMLSSLSSLSSSYAFCESSEDFDKTLVSLPEETSLQPLSQRQPPSPPSTPKEEKEHGWNNNYQTPLPVKLPLKPKALVKDKAFNGSSSDSLPQDIGSSPTECSASNQETLPKDKLLHRRMTNSDLIALATQHRQQHTTHRRRQNLYQMGASNVSDSSDTDTSGHSYSSIDDLLIARHDPEEILLNLGFGRSPDKDILDRIPSRFLQQPSQAKGISTDQFLYQMDELERGCGFSLVGGLRSLGSALRRSSRMSPSPTSSKGPTPPSDNKSVTVILEPQRTELEKNESQKKDSEKKELPKVLPDDMDHNVETAVMSKEVIAGTGHKVKGRSKLIEQSHIRDVMLTPLKELSPVCHEKSQSEFQRAEITTGIPVLSATVEKQNVRAHKGHRDMLPLNSALDMRSENNKHKIQSGSAKLDKRTERELEVESSDKCSPKRELDHEKGSVLQPRILQLSSTHSGAVSGRGLQSREDSFEFEELSSEERLEDVNGAIQPGEAALDNQGNLSRSDSTQSDSSGFADENIGCSEMESPKTPSDGNTTITSDSKITQTSFDADTMEPLDSINFQKINSNSITTSEKIAALTASLESSQGLPSMTSLEDSPFDDEIVVTDLPNSDSLRVRHCTYPAAQEKRVEESGPKTFLEILSSLQTTSKELSKERDREAASWSTRRKHPKLMKMKSVDPEGYGFKCTAESRGIQTRLEDTVKMLHERSCEVLHEVDEDVLNQDCLNLGNVGQRAKDDIPAQSVEHSFPDKPCEQQVIEKCYPAAEKNSEEVCEGSDAAPVESKVIPVCRSQEANERLSLAPSHSTHCSSVKSGHCSESEHQGRCGEEEMNPAIPVLSDSNIVQLSSQVDNSFTSTENMSDKSISENLSSCTKENICSNQLHYCDGIDDVDGEKKEGSRIELTLSEINQCEISSQTSSTVTDEVDTFYFKCHRDKLPFSAYSSSEFEVEDIESKKEHDLDEKLEDNISVRHKDEEEPIQPVETELITASSTVDTSASGVAFNEVSSSEDIACHDAALPETTQPVTTQDTISHSTMLPSQYPEPSLASSEASPLCDKQPFVAQSTAPVVMSVTPISSQVTESDGRRANIDGQSSEAQEGALEVPKGPEQLLPEAASHPLSDCGLDTRINVISSKSDGRSDNLEAQSSEAEEVSEEVPKVSEQVLQEATSHLISDGSIDTRIEMISKEEHCKAREELKELLSAQDYPLLLPSSLLSSARSASHDEAVEDLKLLQRALLRYDRDLEELESWSSKLYKEVGLSLSPEERSDLQSLSSVRHKIKDEIQSLEKNLMEKFQAVITMDRDDESEQDTLWSPGLTHVMCQMVDLLKEQTSLRRFLDELHALEYNTPPLAPWSTGASPKRRNLLAEAPLGGSVDEGDEGDPSEGEADLTDEVTSGGDLTFPQVMTHGELIEELCKAQNDLKKMRVQAKQDVVMAVREVRQSILSEVRREIHMESQLLQVQMQAKDLEIENLRSVVRELKETSFTMSSLETSFQEWSRDKDS